jgi:hypothetical protein
MKVKLFHTTSLDRIGDIMRGGFLDNPTRFGGDMSIMRLQDGDGFYNNTGQIIGRYYTPRVWLGDLPIIDHKLFDDVWGDSAIFQTFITIDMPLPVLGIKSSANAEDAAVSVNARGFVNGILPQDIKTWPTQQFWGRAAIWNRYPRTRISLDDAVKFRLMGDPALLRKIIGRLRQEESFTAFEIQIAKVLIKHFYIKGGLIRHFKKLFALYEEEQWMDQEFIKRVAAAEADGNNYWGD